MRSRQRFGGIVVSLAAVLAVGGFGGVELAKLREQERAALEREQQSLAQLQASFPLRGIADVFPFGH